MIKYGGNDLPLTSRHREREREREEQSAKFCIQTGWRIDRTTLCLSDPRSGRIGTDSLAMLGGLSGRAVVLAYKKFSRASRIEILLGIETGLNVKISQQEAQLETQFTMKRVAQRYLVFYRQCPTR